MRSLKTRVVTVAALAALGAAVGVAGASVAITMKSAMNTKIGAPIVVNAVGKSLYHYSPEKKNTVKCTGACSTEWLPLLVTAGAKPVAGTGVVAAKLGTVKRPDGKLQVTYAGLPLYMYAGDTKAGDVNGQGLGGLWHLIAPSGAVITKAAKSASTSSGGSSSNTGGSSSSSGGSYGGGGSSSGGGGSNTGGGSTVPSSCATDPGGYGCM
jgi:predicted lipoprotein with Yx(FWY)xxD motif